MSAKTTKRVCLPVIAANFLAIGVLLPFAPESQGSVALLGIPALVAMLVWCAADAEQQGRRLSTGMRALIVLLLPVGVPVYLLSRGRSVALLKTVGFYIVIVLISGFASIVTHLLYFGELPILE